MHDTLLTADEVASLLRITRAGLYQLRYLRSAPPAIKVGGRLRWRASDVHDWLDSRSEVS